MKRLEIIYLNTIALAFLFALGKNTFAQSSRFQVPPMKVESVHPVEFPTDTTAWIPLLEKRLGLSNTSFRLVARGKSAFPLTTEYRYQLYLDDVPLRHGRVELSVYQTSKVSALLIYPDYPFSQKTEADQVPAQRSIDSEQWVYEFTGTRWQILKERQNHQLYPAWVSQTNYFSEEGVLMDTEDWLDRFAPGPDSVVKAAVFRPDPCSRLQLVYGPQLRDRSDSNSTWLSQALDTVTIKVLYAQDTFQLRNNRFLFGEFSDPVRPLARLAQPDFRFTRDSLFFEEVNAYYHLNRYRQFVDSLGFAMYADYSLRVDAHGMNGADQSAYSPVMDILAFGEGGVDDAEDATVIVHEYTHVLANDANPLSNSGQERRALEEGICDYVAGSYCRQWSSWNWQNIYKWDGHNEFWAGRTITSTKHYPDNIVNNIHQDGEIWSSAITAIETQIGRGPTHRLLFSIFPQLAPDLKFSQAAFLMMKADTALYSGMHGTILKTAFDDRGIGPGPLIVEKAPLRYGEDFQVWELNGELHFQNLPQERGEIQVLDALGRLVFQFVKGNGITEGSYFLRYPAQIVQIRFRSEHFHVNRRFQHY